MASFEEILNMPSGEIKQPRAFPVGSYHCIVDGYMEHGKSSQKQTDYFRTRLKILRPLEDVDAAQAAEAQVVGKTVINDLYVTDAAAIRLKEFLVNDLGIDNNGGKKSIKEMLSEAPNKQCIVKLKHELTQDGKRVFHRVDSTAHV